MEFTFGAYAVDNKIMTAITKETETSKVEFTDLTIEDITKLEEIVKLAKEQMVKIAESNKTGMTL